MGLKSRGEIVTTIGNEWGNWGESMTRWGGLTAAVGVLILALGYQEQVALVTGGVLFGGGGAALIVGLLASGWGQTQRGVGSKIDELYPEPK